jgi:quercetin dioxygenase-like cupin family protein
MPYRTDIEKSTLNNSKFRKILYTTSDMQLVLMSLNPYQEIGMERHDGTQFIRVENGNGRATVSGKDYILRDGVCLVIDKNRNHNIVAGSEGLKLYTLYSPPQH